MPDVKAASAPCDLPPATPPPGCTMDLERGGYPEHLPPSLAVSVLQGFPHHPHPHHGPYPGLEASSLGTCPTGGSLLGSLGLRYCSSTSTLASSGGSMMVGGVGGQSPRHGASTPPSPRAKQHPQHPPHPQFLNHQQQKAFQAACVNTNSIAMNSSSSSSSRLYRSMENLNWAVSDHPSLCGLSGGSGGGGGGGVPYRSVDSEFILHCTSTTSHWYDGPAAEDCGGGLGGVAFYPRRALARRDLFPHWMFPSGNGSSATTTTDEWGGVNGNAVAARKGLRDKLRLQSARVAEPLKPLRPQQATTPTGGVVPGAPYAPAWGWGWNGGGGGGGEKDRTHHHHHNQYHRSPSVSPPRSLSARRITSPEEIKQEVMRRLRLRRQNSSPNLAVTRDGSPASTPPPQEPQNGNMSRSFTSEALGGSSGGYHSVDRKRPPMGRLHIPTFEEFKRMRQRDSSAAAGGGGGGGQLLASATLPSSGQNKNCSQNSGRNSDGESNGGGHSSSNSSNDVQVSGQHSHSRSSSGNQDVDMDQESEESGDKDRDTNSQRTITTENNKETLSAVSDQSASKTQNQHGQALGKNTNDNIQSQCLSQSKNQNPPGPCQSTQLPLQGDNKATPSSTSTTSLPTATAPICTGPAPRSPLPPVIPSSPQHHNTSSTNNTSKTITTTTRAASAPPNPDKPSLPGEEEHHQQGALVPLVPGGGTGGKGGVIGGGGGVFPPGRKESGEAPSTCCPALLLEGADLSSYGARIYSMRDGLLGSALDLIKKSCSAETVVEASVRLSRERNDEESSTSSSPSSSPGNQNSRATHHHHHATVAPDDDSQSPHEAPPPPPARGRQSAGVAMETPACRAGAGCGDGEGEGEEDRDEDEESSECLSGPGCRRSSSDAAYETCAEAVRAQRECRLRPHYSDPMPADAAKRKQLEMKIAAAARLHSHRRDRDHAIIRGRSEPRGEEPIIRGRSEPRGEERSGLCGGRRAGSGQHRWSTVSSLSADSGVVGLSDEREDEDEPLRHQRHSAGADVERTDSGIGPCLARGWKRPSAALRAWEARRPCPDCGKRELGNTDTGGGREPMCERCSKQRTERKEAILEFLNTEGSYGEDLRIIREEFYCPMLSAGLLTAEQLATVFSNVQELIDVNERFTEHLQESIDQAFDQGDEDLLSVCIGEIFLEFVNMLPAFQTYCLQQSASVTTLNTLEKEKELLRIFLDVSQNDNTALRRMNLRSFLMAPLQRVTKYPLLLSRISKATADCHPDHARLREAKSRVESHLEHINMKTRQEGLSGTATWSLRSFRRDSRKNREVINIEMREVSLKTVGWTRESTRFVMEGPLQLSQPTDGQWSKKGSKALKFQNVQSLLMVHTLKSPEPLGEIGGGGVQKLVGVGSDQEQGGGEAVRDGVLVLIKDKSSGKFTVLREPIRLANCVVSADPDCEDTFEVLDIRREAFVFRASDKARTQQWYRMIKRYTCDLGPWRKRRNALPNIMINTIQSRS
ncbi:uncharacterized protein si:dkey-91i10.2 [Engraulis encrasicolus]|uniref:uncharacterized protein si:dkey-91i10.2 n=1 Tax=Engraulis encrasicolus TaxID=184585 RepID=UPI002FD00268